MPGSGITEMRRRFPCGIVTGPDDFQFAGTRRRETAFAEWELESQGFDPQIDHLLVGRVVQSELVVHDPFELVIEVYARLDPRPVHRVDVEEHALHALEIPFVVLLDFLQDPEVLAVQRPALRCPYSS